MGLLLTTEKSPVISFTGEIMGPVLFPAFLITPWILLKGNWGDSEGCGEYAGTNCQ